MVIRNIKLWFCRGTSDKTYELIMSEQNEGGSVRFTVIGKWGRRGGTKQEQVKVSTYSRYSADRVYDQLMAQKIQKGYSVL